MGAQSKLIPPPPIVRSTYPQRVRQNILPHSEAGTLPKAFSEWHFTENVCDHEEPIATCGLCDKDSLRYHFEIKNQYTQHTLWVGSKCILQFGIPVFEGSVPLDRGSAQRKLNDLKRKMRHDSCVKALTRVTGQEDTDILFNALNYYRENGYLTPKQAFVVFWKLEEYRIDHNPKFFKISLKTSNHKRDLHDMPSCRVNKFWPALSASQRRIAARLGHCGPNGSG